MKENQDREEIRNDLNFAQSWTKFKRCCNQGNTQKRPGLDQATDVIFSFRTRASLELCV